MTIKPWTMLSASLALMAVTVAAQAMAQDPPDAARVKHYYETHGLWDSNTPPPDPSVLRGVAQAEYQRLLNDDTCRRLEECPALYQVDADGIDTLAIERADAQELILLVYTPTGDLIASGFIDHSMQLRWNR